MLNRPLELVLPPGHGHRMDKRLTEFARHNRKNPTRAEAMLWSDIRGRQLGYKFRRQQPIGPFIVDFVCHEKKLIVELDGWTHDFAETHHYDLARQRWLEAEGFAVLRFSDDEVAEERDGVVAAIQMALSNSAAGKVPRYECAEEAEPRRYRGQVE